MCCIASSPFKLNRVVSLLQLIFFASSDTPKYGLASIPPVTKQLFVLDSLHSLDPGAYLREMKELPNVELLQGFSTHEVRQWRVVVSRVATWECGSPKRQLTELVELVYYNLMTMLANYALVGGLEHFFYFSICWE